MELLTVQETARLLKVNPITIRRYIENGKLSAVRVGKGVRVRKEAVDQLLTSVEPKKMMKPKAPGTRAPLTPDDPLWQIVGIGASLEPTDVAQHKGAYLAEAYTPQQG